MAHRAGAKPLWHLRRDADQHVVVPGGPRRLGELPLVHAAFAEGRLSYSKARALTRIATPPTEADLVALAAQATAAHLDRIARARRSVSANETDEANARHEARHVHWFWDEDGHSSSPPGSTPRRVHWCSRLSTPPPTP